MDATTSYRSALDSLNSAQRQAVELTDGPVMVVAGPGTGKTQLLSTRAAFIVQQGNVAANNILCLSFTETAASEMRSRLLRIMGSAGSDVAVHTFHGFGSWLINQYPELFSQERSLQPLDELGRYEVFESLLADLPLRHALAVQDENRHYIRHYAVQEAIRAFKQAGMKPLELRKILRNNQSSYKALEPLLNELFGSTLSAKRLPAIELSVTQQIAATTSSYELIVLHSLHAALNTAIEAGKTASLGSWRTKYTVIESGKRTLKAAHNHQLVLATVDLYEKYQHRLAELGVFDYEDMIIWATTALHTNSDLRLELAERFQYIMVDEFQDTNGGQNRLLDQLLQANPLNSPNVLVVGDDDQAIMRFQGAEQSGMLTFIEQYRPTIIVLQENYRSTQALLDASRQIIIQTDERLEVNVSTAAFSKQLTAQANKVVGTIAHDRYSSPAVAYQAVADNILSLLTNGVAPEQIGVIGRKHADLESFVPFLAARNIAASYERREHILDNPTIKQLLNLAKLVNALTDTSVTFEPLLAAMLTSPAWNITPIALYELAAQARSTKLSWLDVMLKSDDDQLRSIAHWLLAAANENRIANFTQMFDILLGRQSVSSETTQYSPIISELRSLPTSEYVKVLSHLIRLRRLVLEHQPAAKTLADFVTVLNQYDKSGLFLLNNSPLINGHGVQVMTGHGSKGREFEYVFILSAVDEVWGRRARSTHNRIPLPENLPLYPAGDSDSDRLRLLYVAMTRSKGTLRFISYRQTEDGGSVTPLSYLSLGAGKASWQQPIDHTTDLSATQSVIETSWHAPSFSDTSLATSLAPALERFRLSPTALRDYLDICYGGPQTAIEKHVLKFPSAYNDRSALGSAVHKTMQQAYEAFSVGKPLNNKSALAHFNENLDASGLTTTELQNVRRHGESFIPSFITKFARSDFAAITKTEEYLRAELPAGKIPISGVIDALQAKPFKILDYKTGAPPQAEWQTKGLSEGKRIGLHFYRQQLLFYKLLVEYSHNYKDQRVTAAELIFTEPPIDDSVDYIRLGIYEFDATELERLEHLIAIVYTKILKAELPDISAFPKNLKGIIAFEEQLLRDA
jgi:DNA helicase-2/ATP-dependent DNA helicase PcrA